MAVADVMLRIGSEFGPGGLASLQAGLTMVKQFGGAILDAVAEADKFALAMRNVDMAIVNMADSAAAGQIDTGSLIKQMSMLKESAKGVEITSEQFKIMAARAADFAEKSGKDATEVWERMTNGIARAESEALKPFGIKLKENIDMTVTQHQAINELTDGFETFEYQAKSNTQRMGQLNNNWDTFTKLIFKAIGDMPGISSGLGSINKVLSETNKALSETSNSVNQYVSSLDHLKAAYMDIARGDLRAASIEISESTKSIGTAFLFLNNVAMGNLPAAAAEFKAFINSALNDADLRAQRAFEARKKLVDEALAAGPKEHMSYKWTAGGWNSESTGGGGGGGRIGGEGSDVPGSGMSFYDVSPDDWTIGTTSATENDILGRRQNEPGKISNVTAGRFGSASDWEKTKTEIEASVDAQAELLRLDQERWSLENKISDAKTNELEAIRMQNLETQARIQLLGDEEYQAELAKVKEEQRNLQEAERRAMIDADRFDALTFSGEFTATWISNIDMISARVDEFKDQLQLVGQTWTIMANTARQTSLIAGTAIGDMVEDSRVAVLVESTLKAALATADAVEAFASEQYLKGALYTTAAALYTVSAVKAGVDIGKGGVGNSKSGYTGAASHSSFTPDYNGGYMQGRDSGPQEHVFLFVLDDRGLFTIVKEGNSQARRSGEPSFKIESAA